MKRVSEFWLRNQQNSRKIDAKICINAKINVKMENNHVIGILKRRLQLEQRRAIFGRQSEQSAALVAHAVALALSGTEQRSSLRLVHPHRGELVRHKGLSQTTSIGLSLFKWKFNCNFLFDYSYQGSERKCLRSFLLEKSIFQSIFPWQCILVYIFKLCFISLQIWKFFYVQKFVPPGKGNGTGHWFEISFKYFY